MLSAEHTQELFELKTAPNSELMGTRYGSPKCAHIDIRTGVSVLLVRSSICSLLAHTLIVLVGVHIGL